MSLRFSMDTVRYRDNLNRFVVELNADGAQLLKEEMRLLLRDILRFTPPNSLAQGRAAVERDLRRVARPLEPGKIQMPRLAEAVQKKDLPAINAIVARLGGGWGGRTIIAGLDAIRATHERARNRYGRIGRDLRNLALFSDWRSYLRTVQSRVGYTRSGWLPAARAVGLPQPSWVTRHAGYSSGSYDPPTPDDLTVTAINRSVKIPNYEQRHVYPAVAARAKSIASELRRLLAGGKSRRASLAGTASA